MAKKKDEYVESAVFKANSVRLDVVAVDTCPTCGKERNALRTPKEVESVTLFMQGVSLSSGVPWKDIDTSRPIEVVVRGMPKRGYAAEPPRGIELPEETEET